MGSNLEGGCLFIFMILVIASIPAWLTHVYTCIINEQWIFLLAGAIMAPIGVLHGWGIWFGIF